MSYARDQAALAAVRPAAQTTKPRSRPAPGQPFDPNELSRRLRIVLADQKVASEKKRRVRAEIERQRKEATVASIRAHGNSEGARQKDPSTKTLAPASSSDRPGASQSSRTAPSHLSTSNGLSGASGESSSPMTSRLSKTDPRWRASMMDQSSMSTSGTKENGTHPYVPKEAASQFARTTTAVGMLDGPLANRMSRQALKAHLMGNGNDRGTAAAGAERNRSLRKSQSHMDRLNDRIQVQHSRIPEESAAIEDARDKPNHRHTIQGSLGGRTSSDVVQPRLRRNSTGDLLGAFERDDEHRRSLLVEEAIDADTNELIDPARAAEHRVDWTQSDEAKRAASPSVLRPRSSFWTLRGKLGGFRHRDDKGNSSHQGQTDGTVPPMSPKSPKTGFFSRFKH